MLIYKVRDNLIKLINGAMPEILRISKRVLLTCGNSNIALYPKPKWILAWINTAGANMNSWGFSCWQPILAYGKDPYLENGMGARQDIIIDNSVTEKWIKHSCSKPVPFWTKLLLRGSVKESDKILDPFAGSCTTAVVCKRFNRQFVCIEIDPDYCEIGRKRIKAEYNMFEKL